MRKITSLTAALAFVLTLLTSIILYIVPQGRVAYWADWRLWGLTKTEWGNLHINLGLLFFIALFLHVYYNWKPLMAYLKNRARQFNLFTRAFNIALLVTLVCAVGTYFLIPPFSWVMVLNDHFKESGAARYGEPPYGHAELSSLKVFAGKMNLDLGKSMALLEKAGFKVEDPEITLAAIGRQYAVPPQVLYQAMAPVAQTTGTAGTVLTLPESPPPGTGNLTLEQLCDQYGLDAATIVPKLAASGLAVAPNVPLKQAAADNKVSPIDLFERIRRVAAGATSAAAGKER